MMGRGFWLSFVLATWGLAGFLMKVVGVRLDAASALFGIVIGYAIVGITTGLIDGGTVTFNGGFVWAMLVGASYILGNWGYVRLAKTEDVSALAPITGLNVAIPILLGIIVLGEPITVRKLVGVAFAGASIYLLAARS